MAQVPPPPQGYYDSYGLSPNLPPPHPDRSYAPQHDYETNNMGPNNTGMPTMMRAPPPPTLQQIHQDFGYSNDYGPTTPTSNAGPPSVINVPTVSPPQSEQPMTPATMATAASPNPRDMMYQYSRDPSAPSTTPTTTTPPTNAAAATSGFAHASPPVPVPVPVPAHILAQEQAIARAQQQAHLSNHDHNPHYSQQQQQLHHQQQQVDHFSQNTHMIQVPQSRNPMGSDAIHPHRKYWKQTRGTKTAVGAASGALVGGLILAPVFPVGMALGGVAGGYAVNKMSKSAERKAQREWEKQNFQKGAAKSQVILQEDAMLV